jgi:hypothetical protein
MSFRGAVAGDCPSVIAGAAAAVSAASDSGDGAFSDGMAAIAPADAADALNASRNDVARDDGTVAGLYECAGGLTLVIFMVRQDSEQYGKRQF